MMYLLNKDISDSEFKQIFDDFPMQKLTYKQLSDDSNAAYHRFIED